MAEQPDDGIQRKSKWKALSNTLDALGTPVQKLLALVAFSGLILSIVGAILAVTLPATYAGLVKWGRDLVAANEQPTPAATARPPVPVTTALPSRQLSDCKKDLSLVFDELQTYVLKQGYREWNLEGAFRATVWGQEACFIAELETEFDMQGEAFRATLHTSAKVEGGDVPVIVHVETRERPSMSLPRKSYVAIRGTLTKLSRYKDGFTLLVTDATVSDKWAEALRNSKSLNRKFA